jgi:hypothetical protein
MVIEGQSNASGSVIVVEPVRESPRASKEEIRKAVRNDGVGFRGWLAEEGAWIMAQLAKTAVSVAIFRMIHQLFRAGFASERVYRSSPDLWTHGHQGQTSSAGNRTWPEWSRASTGPFNAGPSDYSSSSNRSTADAPSEQPKYVCTIEGRHLYAHARRLHPEQSWPCPLLLQAPCRTCSFLEYDSASTPQCAAVWKMKAVIHGIDGGESLDDVRDWIRNS